MALSIFIGQTPEIQKRLRGLADEELFSIPATLSSRQIIAFLSRFIHYYYVRYSNELHTLVSPAQLFTPRTHHVMPMVANHPRFFRFPLVRSRQLLPQNCYNCGTNSREDDSSITTYLISLNPWSTYIYHTWTRGMHLLIPLCKKLTLPWVAFGVCIGRTISKKNQLKIPSSIDVNNCMTYELCGTLNAFGPKKHKKGI